MFRTILKVFLVIVFLGVAVGGAAWYMQRGATEPVQFRTEQARRGDITLAINATGTVEPEELVDVGAQVAGRILSFGNAGDGKVVDYGSEVEDGTVLARIDDSMYAAEEAQGDAQLKQAQASLRRAEADLNQMKAKLELATLDWDRARKLRLAESYSQATFESYKSAYDAAAANVAVGEASILQAKAAIVQADASLRRAQYNLGYCTIKSPVKGVIIDRRVNIGQTVVSSLNAPSLFLIAKDLKRMQVWVAVNEADIGKVRVGQPVSFTVDAFPGETFSGEVGKIRLNATVTQNVVTYTVEVLTDNSTGRLLPYLTANVRFVMDKRADVLQVPNAALRWTPKPEQASPQFRDAIAHANGGKTGVGGTVALARQGTTREKGQRRGVVWTRDGEDGLARPVKVAVGLSDGTVTEVEGDEIKEGIEVIVGQQATTAGLTATTTNPFSPAMRGGGGGRR